MTATANFRQVAQNIGLAVCGLIVRTAFGMFGILLGIISEIVNGYIAVDVCFHHILEDVVHLIVSALLCCCLAVSLCHIGKY